MYVFCPRFFEVICDPNKLNLDMELKGIKAKKEYAAALEQVDKMFDKKVGKNSREGEAVQVALLLIKQYEDIHYPIPM
jgi:HTH-type transcriptional regulator / antitoxin HigA